MSSATATMSDPLTRWVAIGFACGVTVHNLEEALFLLSWISHHLPWLYRKQDQRVYWVLTTGVSVIVILTVVGLLMWPDNRQLLYAFSGFAIAMSINAIIPHLVASLKFRSYCPGTATGVLLNLGFGVWFLSRVLGSALLTWSEIWKHSLIYTAALALLAFGTLHITRLRQRVEHD